MQSPAPAASNGRSRRRRGSSASASERAAAEARDGAKPTPLAVNDPLAFISFIAEHSLGKELEGEVEGYTSHGAVVRVGDMLCYVPLANLGHPPPRSAREVLKRHERATFVLTALDPQRRGAELALPGIARVSGHPSKETVDAEVRLAKSPQKRVAGSGTRRSELGKPPVPTAATPPPGRRPAGRGATDAHAVEAPAAPVATALPAEAPAKAPAKKAPAKKAPAKKAAAKKGPAKEGPAKEAAAAKKAPPRAGRAAKKAPEAKPVPAKSSAAKKVASPRQGSREQAAPAKKSPSSGSDQASRAGEPRKSAASKRAAGSVPASPAKAQAASEPAASRPVPTKARRRAPKSAVTKRRLPARLPLCPQTHPATSRRRALPGAGPRGRSRARRRAADGAGSSEIALLIAGRPGSRASRRWLQLHAMCRFTADWWRSTKSGHSTTESGTYRGMNYMLVRRDSHASQEGLPSADGRPEPGTIRAGAATLNRRVREVAVNPRGDPVFAGAESPCIWRPSWERSKGVLLRRSWSERPVSPAGSSCASGPGSQD